MGVPDQSLTISRAGPIWSAVKHSFHQVDQVRIGEGSPNGDGDGNLGGGHGSPLASASFLASEILRASRRKWILANSMLTGPAISRFAFHWPSSIAACLSVALICDTRASSSFQISCSAFFPT